VVAAQLLQRPDPPVAVDEQIALGLICGDDDDLRLLPTGRQRCQQPLLAFWPLRAQVLQSMRTTNHAVDTARCATLEIGGGVPGSPGGGSEMADTLYRCVSGSGQDVSEVFALRDLHSAAAFDHREDGRYLWSGLLAADMDRARR